MLKISGVTNKIEFEFTDVDESVHNLEVTSYSISDIRKLIEIQEPLVKNKDMSLSEQTELIVISRIVCAIKIQGTDMFFWNSVEDFVSKGYPNSMINDLYPIVNELNPISKQSDFNEKKS